MEERKTPKFSFLYAPEEEDPGTFLRTHGHPSPQRDSHALYYWRSTF